MNYDISLNLSALFNVKTTEKNGKKYSKYSTQLRDSDKKQTNIHLQTLLKTLESKNKSE